MPCGQKKSMSEMIQSQTVTPPLAAIEGTTLRLKTATTKSKTRSQRPSTRRRCGTSLARGAADAVMTSFVNDALSMVRGPKLPMTYKEQAGLRPGVHMVLLVARGTDKGHAAFVLSLCKRRCNFLKHSEVLVDVGCGVLNGDGPLFIPPIGLCQHAAIDHAKPVVAPQIDINLGPVAVVLNFLRIKHQGAVDAGAGNVGLQTGFLDNGAVALGKSLAELADVRVIFARQDFAESCEAGGHGHAVRVVRAAVEDLVLRDQIHHRTARAECSERQTTTDGLGQADHVRLYAEEVARAAPGKLGSGFHFVKNQQSAVLGADITQSLQKSGLRQAQSDVHEDGLENDGGDLAGILLESIFDALHIVEAGDDNILERSFRHATAAGNGVGRIWIAVVFCLGLDADERGVMQSVVGAFKLQDFVAARSGPRDAAGVHGDFRAARAEAHHVHRIALANLFGKFPFLLVRHAESGSFMKFLHNGLYDGGMAMPSHQRAEAQVVVDVFVAVEVVNAATFAILHKKRIGLVMAIVAGNAEGDEVEGSLVGCRRFRRALFVGGDFFL